ncbi:MAG TPA: right-handed parallel beta-helix repeat-containing protein [Actinomycetota bacterium]|jgi:parallel beta-helix repeat protein
MLTPGDERRPRCETGVPRGLSSAARGNAPLIAAMLGLLPVLTACFIGSTGGPPWTLDGVPLPMDENSIQRTIDAMSTVSAKYELTFLPGDREPPSLFALRPLGLEVYRVDAEGHLGVGRESSEWGHEWTVASISVPMTARGGLPGDTALGFLRDFTERVSAGGGLVDSQNLEPDVAVVWVATEVAGMHGFVWGVPASPWVFEAEAEAQADVARLVRAFAEAALAANRDRAFSRAADLAGSTLLVTSDTTLRDDHRGSVEIEADDVSLDCAGHTISGPGTRAEDEYGFVGILLDGRTGVAVKDCRVSGFDYGILLTARLGSGSDRNRLIDNAAFGNRLDGVRVNESEHNVLTGNIASSNGQHGFAFEGNLNVVTGNQAFDNELDGFVVGAGRRDIVFYDNISKGNQYGFAIVGTGHTVVRNTAANNVDHGFWIAGDSVSVRRNRAVLNGLDGFALDRGSKHHAFYGNRSIRNGAHGFGILGTEHAFVRNKASVNGLVGFAVGLGSRDITFEGNMATGNKIHGFQVSDSRGNTFIRNTASANRAVGFSLELGARENLLYRNSAYDNGEDGFRMIQDSIRNTFRRNVALDNRWSGFRAEAGPNLFLNNRACKNGDADALDVSSYSRWMNNVFCVVGGALELSQQSRQHVIVLLARLSST